MADHPAFRITALLTGRAEAVAAKSGLTGYFKRPRQGPVEIGPGGLQGDTIVDTDHHGGPDQAVYLIGSGDVDHWAARLGSRPLPGFLGENVVLEGWTSAGAQIGDRITLGGAEVALTAPRIPCATLAAIMGGEDPLGAFFDAGHPGAYARVTRAGTAQAGDAARVTPAPGEALTIAELLAATRSGHRDPDLWRRILDAPAAHAGLIEMAKRKSGAV